MITTHKVKVPLSGEPTPSAIIDRLREVEDKLPKDAVLSDFRLESVIHDGSGKSYIAESVMVFTWITEIK